MVEKPKWTGSPVLGCCHVRAASSSIAQRSSPLSGGAANSWPMTEKRKCAHRSCTRVCLVIQPLSIAIAPTVEWADQGRRRASLADLGRPLSSVASASGDGSKEAQQRDDGVGAVVTEAIEQRSWQGLVLDRRHECGPGDLPERRRREVVAPPSAPALDGAAIDT